MCVVTVCLSACQTTTLLHHLLCCHCKGAFSFDPFDEDIEYCAFRRFVVGHSLKRTYNNTHEHTYTHIHTHRYTQCQEGLLEKDGKGRDIRMLLDTYLWPSILAYMGKAIDKEQASMDAYVCVSVV